MTRDHAYESRLAGTIGTNNAANLTLVQEEGNILTSYKAAEAFGEDFGSKERRHVSVSEIAIRLVLRAPL